MLLTFVYTRCPMPNFCPRLSSQFARIHDDLAKTPDLIAKTHLLTVSFDPKYDTAPVLRRYGLAYLDNDASGFAQWDFASAAPSDLRKLANAFGLIYLEQGNQISHSMDIVLISPQGKIVKYWATDWTTAELEDALRTEAICPALGKPCQPEGCNESTPRFLPPVVVAAGRCLSVGDLANLPRPAGQTEGARNSSKELCYLSRGLELGPEEAASQTRRSVSVKNLAQWRTGHRSTGSQNHHRRDWHHASI